MMKHTGNSLTVRLPDSHCSSFNDNWMCWTTIFVPMPVLIMLSVCCMFVGRLFIRKWREWRRTGETEKTSTSTTRGSFLNVYTQSIINWLSGSYSRKSILVLEVINQDFCWKFPIFPNTHFVKTFMSLALLHVSLSKSYIIAKWTVSAK